MLFVDSTLSTRRNYVIGVAGLLLNASWLILASWILLMAAGAAGIGVSVAQTLLPPLLVIAAVGSLLALIAVMWRPAAVVLIGAGVVVVFFIALSMSDWHPDYRPTLTAIAGLSLFGIGWGSLALGSQQSR